MSELVFPLAVLVVWTTSLTGFMVGMFRVRSKMAVPVLTASALIGVASITVTALISQASEPKLWNVALCVLPTTLAVCTLIGLVVRRRREAAAAAYRRNLEAQVGQWDQQYSIDNANPALNPLVRAYDMHQRGRCLWELGRTGAAMADFQVAFAAYFFNQMGNHPISAPFFDEYVVLLREAGLDSTAAEVLRMRQQHASYVQQQLVRRK